MREHELELPSLPVLENGVKEFDIVLSVHQKQQFLTFYELLLQWNTVMNLTAITNFDEVCRKHFLDSISLCRAICAVFKRSDSAIGFEGYRSNSWKSRRFCQAWPA